MELIRQNPYRVIGILAGANQRTIAKQKAKINAFQKVGKSIEFDTDLEFTGNPDRSNGAVEKAFANIEINQNKLFNALFWFANNNHLDETALNYLQSGDLEKAEEIWQKVTTGKEVSSKNFTAYNNLGSLKLATAFANGSIDMENLKEAVRLKTELLTSDSFNDFCHLVADETYIVDQDKELEIFVNALLEEVNKAKNTEAKKIPAQIGSIHPKIKSLVSEKLTDTPLHNIERKTEQTKKTRNENAEGGLQLARKLYRDTKSDLSTLSELLGKADLKYKMVADKLAKELLQCGIDYFKEYQEDEELHDGDLGNDVLKLFKTAKTIAVGAQIKDRVDDNIEGLSEWIENNERIKQLPEKWLNVLNGLKSIGTELEDKETSPKDALKVINSFSIDELNELGEFADQFRVSVALILRGISVSIWNNHHDIDTAIKVILKALKIELDLETKEKLNSDYSQLKKLKKELDEQGKPISSAPSLHTVNGIGTTIYGKTLYFVFFAIPIIPIARYNCEPTINGYRFFGKVKLHTWQKVWQYGVLLAVAYFVIKMIIQSN